MSSWSQMLHDSQEQILRCLLQLITLNSELHLILSFAVLVSTVCVMHVIYRYTDHSKRASTSAAHHLLSKCRPLSCCYQSLLSSLHHFTPFSSYSHLLTMSVLPLTSCICISANTSHFLVLHLLMGWSTTPPTQHKPYVCTSLHISPTPSTLSWQFKGSWIVAMETTSSSETVGRC